MRTAPLASLGIALALATTACTGGDDGESPAGGVCDAANGKFSITDDTNYSLPASISVQKYAVKDATDILFDWGGLTQDFYGQPLDPKADIDLVLLSLWHKTPAELEAALTSDNLPPSENIGVITTYPMDAFTSRHLLEFDFTGTPVPPDELWQYFDTKNPRFHYPPAEYTFLLEASTGTVLGKGARMLAFLGLDPNGADDLTLTNDSATVDFSVHLASARPVHVPVAMPALTIDWSTMTKNALGNDYDGIQITRAVVAHYSTETLADLESDFLKLQTLADGWWSGKVLSGKSIDLDTLTDESGAPFPGIDDQGIWLTALFCTTNCNNPAPWSITILEPCR
jgi:hypothetical protein